MVKDPVCGMMVREEKRVKLDYQGQSYYFCSDFCRNLFDKDPDRYVVLIRPCVAPGTEKERSFAYFSMEIAIDSRIPNGIRLRACLFYPTKGGARYDRL